MTRLCRKYSCSNGQGARTACIAAGEVLYDADNIGFCKAREFLLLSNRCGSKLAHAEESLGGFVDLSVWANQMSSLTRLIRSASIVRANCRGVSSVEFALAAPLLVAILTVLVDYGIGFYEKMQVEDAAQAGAQYALLHGWNSDAIQNAVVSATTLSGVSASPAPTKTCGCPSGSTVTAADCSGVCANGLSPGTYVTVNAQATYVPLISYPVMGSSVTLTGQSMARIK